MTSIKPSEYYGSLAELDRRAESQEAEAQRAVAWWKEALAFGRTLKDDADAHGLPTDAVEQLCTYRKMLDEGPPTDGGYIAPKEESAPARSRREREPCPGVVDGLLCGKRRGHIAGCPEAAKRPAVQQINVEARAEDGARVELAGRIRREVSGWSGMLASEVATALGVPMADVVAAWPLLTGEKTP